MLEEKRLREGWTTGSCAAAAVAAAAEYLLDGVDRPSVAIDTPAGKRFIAEAMRVAAGEGFASFAVVKDAGDDPDMTDGMRVCARVDLLEGDGAIAFRAGQGVGVVTKPGLKIPPGEPAINPVPRAMIEREFRSRFPQRSAILTISIPDGETVAKRTFNPRLGIEGGLSVLGTSGVVRPMSTDAIRATIVEEMNMIAAQGLEGLTITFGAMGEAALEKLGYARERMLQASNYVGFAIDRAVSMGFTQLAIAGHAGKVVKLAAGVFVTHSAVADARAETLCCHAALCGASRETLRTLFAALTTKAADEILRAAGLAEAVWQSIADEAGRRASRRAGQRVTCVFLDDGGELLVVSRTEEE